MPEILIFSNARYLRSRFLGTLYIYGCNNTAPRYSVSHDNSVGVVGKHSRAFPFNTLNFRPRSRVADAGTIKSGTGQGGTDQACRKERS